jgi:putative N6-adenine-specific DNA methylase
MKIFATCAPGLENLLAEELRRLGATKVHAASRGVEAFGGDILLWRANIESRLAERILVPLGEGPGGDERQVKQTSMAIDWKRHIPRGCTFAVDASVAGSKLNHRIFVGQLIKDGVCDRLRKDTGTRPDVDPKRPDVWVRARLYRDRLNISWDSSGIALHQRGYRSEAGEAPLRETMASALLAAAGFDGREALLDPMCGSGTLVIEGAQIARRIAPGLRRAEQGHFAFQKAPKFDAEGFAGYLEELRAQILPDAPQSIVGSDKDGAVTGFARRNAERAGVAVDIRWNSSDFRSRLPADVPTLVVVNPPFGERMGEFERAKTLLAAFGDHLKTEFTGHRAAMILGSKPLVGAVGLRPSARIPVRFAKFDARLVIFDLYEGSRKDGGKDAS